MSYYLTRKDKIVEFLCRKKAFMLRKLKGNVLEVGIGEGLLSKELVKLPITLSACEPELSLIEYSKNLYWQTYNCKIEDLVTTDKFDYIILSDVLEHVENPILCLQKCKTLLKENGKIYIFVPNANSYNRLIGVQIGMLQKHTDLNEGDIVCGHKRVYTRNSLKNDIWRSRLRLKYIRTFFLKTQANNQMQDISEEMMEALFKVKTGNNGAEFVVICQ